MRAQDLHESDYTPWEGHEVGAWPVLTVLRGKVVVADGQFHGDLDGRAVPQAPHPGRHPGASATRTGTAERDDEGRLVPPLRRSRSPGLRRDRQPTPGPGEAVVRVRAVGINHVDLDHRAGTSRIPVAFPHILGREFAGEIAALGGEAGPLRKATASG